MERKPLPASAVVAPQTVETKTAIPTRDVLDWEESATTKKSLFSKPKFFSFAGKDPLSGSSVEEGKSDAETGLNKPLPKTSGGFFARIGKKVLIIAAVAIVFIFALGLGLGLGLKKSSKKSANLPLPGSTAIYTGDLTYYSPGPGYGACGYENTSHDKICAVSHLVWDAVSTSSNPNLNPLCGKTIRITRFNSKKGSNSSIDVEVVDRCTGCEPQDLDLSLDMFTTLADESQGRVVGSWAWLA